MLGYLTTNPNPPPPHVANFEICIRFSYKYRKVSVKTKLITVHMTTANHLTKAVSIYIVAITYY